MTTIRTVVPNPEQHISNLLYDSRKLSATKNGLFFALTGRRDGHRYIPEAYAAGVRNFVVASHYRDIQRFPDANFLVVADPLTALQELAGFHRSRFTYPVIGITGSNGKTIVKEWLYELLSPEYRIVRSPKSYNSQLGVALSLWEMDETHNLALIEAGISQLGEMEQLRRMIQPTVAVLTTIGRAHDAGFPSMEIKINEKLRLFEGVSQAVYNPEYIGDAAVPSHDKRVTWGRAGTALEIIDHEIQSAGGCRIRARYNGTDVYVSIPFSDGAARANAVCCWAVLLAMGYDQQTIAGRMARLHPMEMRLEMKQGINNCSVIDDSYSNDLSSLAIALDFLRQQRQHPVYTVVLSDIPGNHNNEEEVYDQVSTLLNHNKINKLISVGDAFIRYRNKFNFLKHHAFPDVHSLLSAFSALAFRDETILLKGARQFAFERISRKLTVKLHETVFEINLNALAHNIGQYRSLLGGQIKLMVMVKAFSYGSGSFEIANLLQFNGVDYLAVAYVDEGVALREAGIRLPIMVMNPAAASFEALLHHQLEPELFSFSVLEAFIRLLTDRKIKNYPIHIKVDTGMHRLGFSTGDVAQLKDHLRQTDTVKVQSVFSHLAAAGDPAHDAFTMEQLSAFEAFTQQLQEALGHPFMRHLANTAAIQRWPAARFDMVRLGIGLYGISDDQPSLTLQPVGTLKTTVAQLRQLPAGETVGYGRRGTIQRDSTIATVKIGYADGYDRRFGNGVGQMLIHGEKVRTIGDICMDMCMLDVTDIPVREGDEVVVLGNVEQLSQAIETIPYELLAGISQRVKRIYYQE